MQKFTLRRILLASAAFILALLSLLSLCFTVVSLELGTGNVVDEEVAEALRENGFDLLNGDSAVLAYFEALVASLTARVSDFEMVDLSPVVTVAQIFNIVILVAAVAMCVGAVAWLFIGKKDNFAHAIAVIAAVLGVLFLAEGLTFTIAMNAEWNRALDWAEVEEGGELLSIVTLCYVPLILIAVFEAAYWILAKNMRGDCAPQEAAMQEAPAFVQAEAPDGQEAERGKKPRAFAPAQWILPGGYMQMMAYTGEYDVALLQYLRELKKLLDEEALTEAEYRDIKCKLLEEKFGRMRPVKGCAKAQEKETEE